MLYISNLYLLFSFGFQTYHTHKEDGKMHQYAKKISGEVAKDALGETGYNTLPPKWLKKMRWYMVESIWLAEQFNYLLGRAMSASEKQNIAYSAGLFTLADLLVDEQEENDMNMISSLFRHPDSHKAEGTVEKLYKKYYQLFSATLPGDKKQEVLNYYSELIDAQLASRRQFDPQTTREEIDQITRHKGGISFVGCRSTIPAALTAGEKEGIYQLGALVQMLNDTQDLHQDSLLGIRNFANCRDSLPEIIADIDEQRRRVFSLIKKLPYPRKRKRRFLFGFHALIVGIYAKLAYYEKLCGGRFSMIELLKLDAREIRLPPFSWQNLKFSIPKLLQFNYEDTERPSRVLRPKGVPLFWV